MFKNKAKKYCIAAGCSNSDKNSNHAFFSIPTREKDTERRREWLTLLGREDLLEKKDIKKFSHFVCSAHFDPSSIKIIKHLNDTAVPTMLLANQPHKESSCTEAKPLSVQFKDTTIILSKSTEGGTSWSATPSTSAQCIGKSKMIVTSNKLVKRSTKTQTNEQEEQQTQNFKVTYRSNTKKRKTIT